MQCDLSLIVLGLAFPEGTRGCRTCIKVIGCKFVYIPPLCVHLLCLNTYCLPVLLFLTAELSLQNWCSKNV